jgi:uncharacterized protein YjiS (DUF1127 family)
MSAPMTKADLFALFPADGSLETEQARGRFAAALRLGQVLALPAMLVTHLRNWIARRRSARALEALPDSMLRDIGLTRAEIDSAAAAAPARPDPAGARPQGLADLPAYIRAY